jgi:hypothetical protein
MVIVLREKILQINTGNGIDFPCSWTEKVPRASYLSN